MTACLYVEMKRMLNCAICVISDLDISDNNSEANTKEHSIQLVTGSKNITWDLPCLEGTLEAGCKFVHSGKSSLTLRVTTYKKYPSSNAAISFGESQTKLVDLLSEDREIVCRCCKTGCLDTSKYRRIMPLPSSGWSEMADSWYCHQPCSSNDSHHTLSLTPKPDDLLVGNYCSLTRLSNLYNAVSDVSDSTSMLCQHCKTVIGQLIPPSSQDQGIEREDSVELYHNKLGYTDSEGILHPLMCLEATLAAHLLEHCQNMMTYKFVLEYKHCGRPVTALLVWVLETDLQLLFGDCEGTVQCFDAVKVLYIVGSEAEPKMITDWLGDNKVSSIAMSQIACNGIEQVLLESTRCLPASMSRTDSMNIGFLKVQLLDRIS